MNKIVFKEIFIVILALICSFGSVSFLADLDTSLHNIFVSDDM